MLDMDIMCMNSDCVIAKYPKLIEDAFESVEPYAKSRWLTKHTEECFGPIIASYIADPDYWVDKGRVKIILDGQTKEYKRD